MFKEIPISAIVRSGNTRSYFDENSLKELSESIKQQGVIQAIVVRKIGKNYQLVVGERRYRASILAGLLDIPANIRELTDEEVLEIQISENLHRDNVNPLDEAMAFKMMQEQKHFTVEEIAARIGKTPGFVRSRLVLNDLIEDAKQLLYTGMLPVTHASKIAILQPKKQKEALNKVIVYDNDRKAVAHKPISDLNWWLKMSLIKNLNNAPFNIEDSELIPSVPSCLNCGKCTINVASLFPEDAANRSCLDPVCYSQKVQAHIAQRIVEITEKNKGVEPIKVSDVHYSNEADVLSTMNYQVRTKKEKCKHCQLGVVAHSNSGLEGQEVWVCQHSVCPSFEIAEQSTNIDGEEQRKVIVKEHATRIAQDISMEMVYEQSFDNRMIMVVEYLFKWTELSSARQQHIITTLKWSCQVSDQELSDIELVDEVNMFYENFHGKDQEKNIIDFEFSLQQLIKWKNNHVPRTSEVFSEIVSNTLNPVMDSLNKENIKRGKKLAEFYSKPSVKELKKIVPADLVRLFSNINALQTLAKRFAIQYDEKETDVIILAQTIIRNA